MTGILKEGNGVSHAVMISTVSPDMFPFCISPFVYVYTHIHTRTRVYICVYVYTHKFLCCTRLAIKILKNPQSITLWSNLTMNKPLSPLVLLFSYLVNRYHNPSLSPSWLGGTSMKHTSGSTLETEMTLYAGVAVVTVGEFP